MPTHRITRRALLGGLGGSGVLAPFVPLLEAHAAPVTPRRLIILKHPNGVGGIEQWRPPGTPTEKVFGLSNQLLPLMDHKDSLVLIEGVFNASGNTSHSFAETELLTACIAEEQRPGDKSSRRARNASVDQVVASAIGADSRLKSLHLGVRNGLGRGQDGDGISGAAVVYTGANQPVLPQSNPYAAFDRVFGTFKQVAANVGEDPFADDKDILSAVTAALNRLKPRLGAQDRVKMEKHLDGVSAIIKTLDPSAGGPLAAPSCGAPTMGTPINWQSDLGIETVAKLQIDIMVAALACDLTRVATLQFGNTGWGATFTWDPFNHTDHHHNNSHNSASAFRQQLTWTTGRVKYLLDGLKSVPEPGGTMLDNTALMWTSEFGDGNTHDTSNLAVIFAGSAGGAWKGKTGRYLTFTDAATKKGTVPLNNVYVSLCRAMGVNVASFGDPKLCTGPLTGFG